MSDTYKPFQKTEVIYKCDSDAFYVGDTPFDYDCSCGLTEMIAWLTELREKAPLEHRADLKIMIEPDTNYNDDGLWRLKVYYMRDETEEEREKRINSDSEYRKARIARLEEELKKLKGE